MSNLIQKTTDFAMHIVSAYIRPGDILVDATCGNGHDTLFLANTSPAKLYGFDIQPSAIASTKELLSKEGFSNLLDDGTIKLICDSHQQMSKYIKEPIKAFVFNLGYLPGGCKGCTTTSSTTLPTVSSALEMLQDNGLICITMYSGHTEGPEEKETLLAFAEKLDPRKYHTAYISMINQSNNPSEILLISKKS